MRKDPEIVTVTLKKHNGMGLSIVAAKVWNRFFIRFLFGGVRKYGLVEVIKWSTQLLRESQGCTKTLRGRVLTQNVMLVVGVNFEKQRCGVLVTAVVNSESVA